MRTENWREASINARNIVDLMILLGRLSEAAEAAQQAIDYGQKSENLFNQMVSYAYLATVLHRQGQDASEAFLIAEQLQKRRQPDSPQLCSLPGFQYCAWLLDQTNSDISQVIVRGEYGLNTTISLLDVALHSLTLAIAYAKLEQFKQAEYYFHQAVAGTRKAGRIDHLVYFLIYRANFFLQQHQHEDEARVLRDLTEARQIIGRSDMKLYAVDYHLAMCRYYRLKQQPKEAKQHLEKSKVLIDVTGYYLRNAEFNALHSNK